MAFVYILQSEKNSTFYIGITINLNRRLYEHFDGKSPYTRNILPIKLVFSQEYENIKLARQAEFWLKKQKDKDFLLKIIREQMIKKTFN